MKSVMARVSKNGRHRSIPLSDARFVYDRGGYVYSDGVALETWDEFLAHYDDDYEGARQNQNSIDESLGVTLSNADDTRREEEE